MSDEQLFPSYNSTTELNVTSFADFKESDKSEYSGDTDFETIFHDYHSVIDCLKSEPFQRSTNDIKVLTEFFQTIPEFVKFSDTQLELACQAAYLQIVSSEECLVKKFTPFTDWMFILDGTLVKIDDIEIIIKPGYYFGVDFFTDDVKISLSDIISQASSKPCSLLVLSPSSLNSPSNHNRQILKYGRDCSLILDTSDCQPKPKLIAMYEALSSSNTNAIQSSTRNSIESNTTLEYNLAQADPSVLINNTLSSDIPWLSGSFVEDVLMTLGVFTKHTECGACGGLDITNVLSRILMLNHECEDDASSSVDLLNLKIEHVYRVLLCAFPIIDENVNLRKGFNKTIDRFLSYQTPQSMESFYLFVQAATISAKVRQYNGISLQNLRCRLKRITEPYSFLSANVRRRQVSDEPSLYYVMNSQLNKRSNTLCKRNNQECEEDHLSDLEEDGIHEGDLIVGIDRYGRDEMTESLMDMLCGLEQNKDDTFTVFVRNDLLGYHQYVMGNISNSMFIQESNIPTNGSGIRSCSSSTNSINSTPSNSQYSRSFSDKQDNSNNEESRQEQTQLQKESPIPQVKRPNMLLLPGLSHLFVGSNSTVGRLFMKRHMKKDSTGSTKSSLTTQNLPTRTTNIFSSSSIFIPRDYTTDSIINQNMAKNSVSSLSLLKLGSRRFKSKASSFKKRRSTGSNPDLSNEFNKSPTSGMGDSPASNSPFQTNDSSRKTFKASNFTSLTASKYPIRIFWRTELLAKPITNQENSGSKTPSAFVSTPTTSSTSSTTPSISPLRTIHLHVDASTCVNETVIRALLQLDLSSASSSEYYLVQVSSSFTAYDQSMSVREKIMRSSDSNLVQRVREGCGFFLKHRTCMGRSWITQQEIEKTILPQYPAISMQHNSSAISVLDLPVKQMAIRLFQLSHRMITRLQPAHIISSLLALPKLDEMADSVHTLLLQEYMNLSNIFKYWTMWEILRNTDISPSKRALIIQYFVNLALHSLHIGHIDLFFNVLCALDAVEISRLTQTWAKVHDKYKKILVSLHDHLDVSSNLRNLRTLHQKFQCPYIPVTAILVKDITIILETQPTWISPNEKQAHKNDRPNTPPEGNISSDLINISKLSRLASITRQFCVTPACNCEFDCPDIRRVSRIHHGDCVGRQPENEEKLLELLYIRLQNSDQIASSPANNNLSEYPFRNPIKPRNFSTSSNQNPTSKPQSSIINGSNTHSMPRKLSISSASSDSSMQEHLINGYYGNMNQNYNRNHSFSIPIANGISPNPPGISSHSSSISNKQYQKLTGHQFTDFSFLCSIDSYIDTIVYPQKVNTDTISNSTQSSVTIETNLDKLMDMSHTCEPPPPPHTDSMEGGFSAGDIVMKGIRQSKRHNKLLQRQNSQENTDQCPVDLEALNISDKAAEILGLKENFSTLTEEHDESTISDYETSSSVYVTN